MNSIVLRPSLRHFKGFPGFRFVQGFWQILRGFWQKDQVWRTKVEYLVGVTVTGTCFFHILGIIAMLVYQRVHPMDILHTICLVGGLEHEWIIFPFSWEWNNHPTDELNHQPAIVSGFQSSCSMCFHPFNDGVPEINDSHDSVTRWACEMARWRRVSAGSVGFMVSYG